MKKAQILQDLLKAQVDKRFYEQQFELRTKENNELEEYLKTKEFSLREKYNIHSILADNYKALDDLLGEIAYASGTIKGLQDALDKMEGK